MTLSPVADIKSQSSLPLTNSPFAKYMKKMYKLVLSTAIVASFSNLMEKLDLYIYKVPLDPSPLLQIASICLSTVEISIADLGNVNGARIIQYGCMNIITRIFGIYRSIRKIIIDDVLSALKNVPVGKKNARNFVLNGISYHFKNATAVNVDDMKSLTGQIVVQNASVLICDLIQSCISRPDCRSGSHCNQQTNCTTPPLSLRESAQITPPENDAIMISSGGFNESMAVCILFSTALLQKCSKRGEEGGASEYRPVLQHLVQDWLQMQLLPEYPAAEIILVTLSKKLCEDMIGCSSISSSSSDSLELTYLTTAIDTLGLICSDICAKIAAAKCNPLIFPKALSLENIENTSKDPSNSETEKNRCFCGRDSYNNTDMLDCDRCHNWFHMSCVGVAKNNLPDRYICDECNLQLWIIDQMDVLVTITQSALVSDSNILSSKEFGHDDKVHIMRSLLIKFMGHNIETENQRAIEIARNFHLARFIHELQDSQNRNHTEINIFSQDSICKYYSTVWNTAVEDSSKYMKGHECEYLSQEGNAKLMLTLNASKSSLVANFPSVLGVIVTLMGDEGTVALRKLALKALSQIVSVEPSIMSRIQIRDAVSMRFHDSAISVREAAVSLVGVYVLRMPESAHMYHDPLLHRLSDSGVSVKKRVVKIFKELLSNNSSYHGRTSVFVRFLEQASDRKEDDCVRYLIYETFQELWCIGLKAEGKTKTEHDARQIARDMIDIVYVSKTSEYLSILVRDLLLDLSDTDKGKKCTRQQVDEFAVEAYFISIINGLLDELVACDDRKTKTKLVSEEHVWRTLVAILETLHLFAEVFPSLLSQTYDPLLPYLKGNNIVPRKFEENIVYNVCKMLTHISKSLAPAEVQRLGYSDLPTDLACISKMFPPKACCAAIETLSTFSAQEGSIIGITGTFSRELTRLTSVFYSYLLKMKDSANAFSSYSTRDKNNIHRALSVIGSICRFSTRDYNITEPDFDHIELIDASLITKENLPMCSFALFQVYLGSDDILTKCKALRALASIFFVHPRFMLAFEQQGNLSEIMSENADPTLQLESLKCWTDILISEETRVESGEAKKQMESKRSISTSKKVSGDQDGDASLIGACCVHHSNRLFAMASDPDSNIRLHVLLLMETLLRQGQLNPMKAIPHLFSLLGDVWQRNIKDISLRLLMDECERRPEMVRQLFCDGIKSCFRFQKKVYGSVHRPAALVNEDSQSECIFGQIFIKIINSSRSHTARVIKSLLGLFHVDRKDNDHQGLDSPLLFSFASEVLVYLPYSHLGDVLFLVHSIYNIAAVKGFELLNSFVKHLKPFGLYNDDVDFDDIDEIEKAALKKHPCNTPIFKTLDSSGFDFNTFAEICEEASKITLLLRVATFLKMSYSGLTAARLIDYHPGQTERPTDRGVIRLSNKSAFSSVILDSKTNGVLNLDNIIRQYAEFRQIMRKDYIPVNISSSYECFEYKHES